MGGELKKILLKGHHMSLKVLDLVSTCFSIQGFLCIIVLSYHEGITRALEPCFKIMA